MGRTKATSGKQAEATSTRTSSRAPRKSQKSLAMDDSSTDDDTPQSPPPKSQGKVKTKGKSKPSKPSASPLRIIWSALRTTRLVDQLTQNVDLRIKLFSDNTQQANSDGRRKKVGKTGKAQYYDTLATGVFSVDEDERYRTAFSENPTPFSRSLENYLTRLRIRYREINTELGQTGAGLTYNEITVGSALRSKVDLLTADFPWWPDLHGMWRTLPNFNPFTLSSEPGQDVSEDAHSMLMPNKSYGNADEEEEPLDTIEEDEKDDDELEEDMNGSLEDNSHSVPDNDSDDSTFLFTTPPPSQPIDDDSEGTFSFAARKTALKSNKPTKLKPGITPSRPTISTPSTSKPSRKRSRLDAFDEDKENDTAALIRLGNQKHARRIAELEIKRRRIDAGLAEKKLAAEQHRLEMEHAREREREQHEMRMLQLRSRASATATPSPSGLLFDGLATFNATPSPAGLSLASPSPSGLSFDGQGATSIGSFGY